MPTLSLRSAIGLFLFFVLLNILPASAYSQNIEGRSQKITTFGNVIIADEKLPADVLTAQKNKVLISIDFKHKKNSELHKLTYGSGTIIYPGVILTNRHILGQGLNGSPLTDYDLSFTGTIFGEEKEVTFPLMLITPEATGSLKDFMALRVHGDILNRATYSGTSDPLKVLLYGLRMADDINIGEMVYVTGFAPVVGNLLNESGPTSLLFIDLINYTFKSEVVAKLENLPMNRRGKLKRLYRIRTAAEPGFSGGMALNAKGEIVGIIVAATESRNFSYLLSAKDIKDFLKDYGLKF